MHGQLIALLGLALALDGVGDIDLEVLGGDDTNGARGQGGEKQGCLHGGETWVLFGARTTKRGERGGTDGRPLGFGAVRKSGFVERKRRETEREREKMNIWPIRNGFRKGW